VAPLADDQQRMHGRQSADERGYRKRARSVVRDRGLRPGEK
jgi:hypothetical protein